MMGTGDLNKDGLPDIAVGSATDTQKSVAVLMNQGNFQFTDPVLYPVAGYVASVDIADVNGDGWPDVVVSHFDVPAISILLNRGDGTLQVGPVLTTSYNVVDRSVMADFNRDGKADI